MSLAALLSRGSWKVDETVNETNCYGKRLIKISRQRSARMKVCPGLKNSDKTGRVHPLTAKLFQTIVGGAIRGRKVRTPQGTVAANGCPPRGEDQSNRDEPALGSVETGNLYGEQHQIGSLWSGPDRLRVDGLRRRASAVLDE